MVCNLPMSLVPIDLMHLVVRFKAFCSYCRYRGEDGARGKIIYNLIITISCAGNSDSQFNFNLIRTNRRKSLRKLRKSNLLKRLRRRSQ